MKKFSLLILSILLLSCSSDDEDAKEGNFLDVNNRVIWKYYVSDYPNESSWYIFKPEGMTTYSNQFAPCEERKIIWGVPFENGSSDGVKNIIITITVLENSKNFLRIKTVSSDSSVRDSENEFTVSENGNVLTSTVKVPSSTQTLNKVSEPCK